MIRIGAFSHRVTVKTFATSSDGQGGTTSTASTVATVWAKVDKKKAKQNLIEGGIFEEEVFEVTMRYETAKNYYPQTHVFQYEGTEMTIHHRQEVKEDEHFLIFTCQAKNLN